MLSSDRTVSFLSVERSILSPDSLLTDIQNPSTRGSISDMKEDNLLAAYADFPCFSRGRDLLMPGIIFFYR